jgi:transforming growth factor-beta-induced protein
MRKSLLILGLVGLLTAAVAAPAAAARPDDAGRPTLLSRALAINAETGEFSTLISLASQYPAVVDALGGKQQLTLFAPTDAAFDALFAFAAENDIELTSELVLQVLLYHVAPGRWSAERIIDNAGGELPTLNGDTLSVTLDGGVFIDQAQVVIADVTSSNGFIHAIDAVLLPGS